MQREEVAVVAIVFAVLGVVGYPLARALARRIEGVKVSDDSAPGGSEVSTRLDRIERAVDAIAVEVERISEGQRFVTKLMAERSSTARLEAPNQG